MSNLISQYSSMVYRKHTQQIIKKMKQNESKASQQKEKQTFGSFMAMKKRKLFQQVHERIVPISNIFTGVSFYVNGYTDPPAFELRKMIVENGGEYHHYWTPKETKYIVAIQLASTKWKSFGKNVKNIVITPKWILECIRAKKRLPVTPFLLIHKSGPKRDGMNRCAGASTLTGLDGNQLSIYNFTTIRRRQKLFNDLYKQKMEMKRQRTSLKGWGKQLAEAKEWIEWENLHGKCSMKMHDNSPPSPTLKFDYGHLSDGESHKIFIGAVQFDYTKPANKEIVQKLAATYKSKRAEPNSWKMLNFSVNFLRRIFTREQIGQEKNEEGIQVHSDWQIVLKLLEKWIEEN